MASWPFSPLLPGAAAGDGGSTGSASITQGANTLSADGDVSGGVASITQGANTLSAAGSVLITGAAALTQGADTLSAISLTPAASGAEGYVYLLPI